MKRKLCTCILLLLAFAMLLCACKKEETPPVETSTGEVEEIAGPLEECLPDMDMGDRDRDFVMITEPTYNEYNFFYGSDYNGDPINDTAYERTSYVEGRYNIEFRYEEIKDTTSALRNDASSEIGMYDLVYPHPTDTMATLLSEGLLTNLLELSYLNLDREWYIQSQVTNYQINGQLLLAASDYSIVGQGIGGILYNLDRYEALGYEEDLYDVVYDGNWTIDKLAKIVKETKADVNGSEETASYGLICRKPSVMNFAYAAGQNILVKNEEGQFELGLKASAMTTIASAMNNLLYETDDNVLFGECTNAVFPTSEMWTTYQQGSSLFITYDFGQLQKHLRDLTFTVGYLPYPTIEAGGNYRTFCGSGFFAIPANAQSLDQSAIILEALSIYSYLYMKPEFFNTILLGRLSENQRDYDMLNFLHSKKFYDFGFTFDQKGVAKNMLYNVLFSYKDVRAVTTYMKGHSADMKKVVDAANGIVGG